MGKIKFIVIEINKPTKGTIKSLNKTIYRILKNECSDECQKQKRTIVR